MTSFPHAWLVLLLAGCGAATAAPDLNLVPVTGTVMLDGKPLANATVLFNPLQGTKGTGGYGVTDAEGKFSIKHRSEKEGCEAGDYGVTFTKITQPDGSPLPPNADRATVGMVEQIPAAYVQFDPSAVLEKAKVVSPSTTLEFRLDPKKKLTMR